MTWTSAATTQTNNNLFQTISCICGFK